MGESLNFSLLFIDLETDNNGGNGDDINGMHVDGYRNFYTDLNNLWWTTLKRINPHAIDVYHAASQSYENGATGHPTHQKPQTAGHHTRINRAGGVKGGKGGSPGRVPPQVSRAVRRATCCPFVSRCGSRVTTQQASKQAISLHPNPSDLGS